MVTKVLHACNSAVAFATVAQAADVTLTGGAGTVVPSALASLKIFKKAKPQGHYNNRIWRGIAARS